jgi:hypothetical protein
MYHQSTYHQFVQKTRFKYPKSKTTLTLQTVGYEFQANRYRNGLYWS